METVKFIHAADLHLDSPFKGLSNLPFSIYEQMKESTFSAFHRMIRVALQEKIDFLLIAGDLFDESNRSLKAQIQLRNGFEQLAEANIQVYIIHGNHDHLGGKWAKIKWPQNVHFFPPHVDVLPFKKDKKTIAHIYGFSYDQREVFDNRTKEYIKKEGAIFHIGMLHGNVNGAKGHDQYAPFTIQELIEKDFDYWALGHIHTRQTLHKYPHIIYPGNIQGRHRKETGEKGCYLIELSKRQTVQRFICCSPIIWRKETILLNEVASIDDFIQEIQTCKKRLRKLAKGTFLELELVGTCQFYEELQQTQMMEELYDVVNEEEENEHSFVWVHRMVNQTTLPYDRAELKKQSHFISDLLRQIDEYDQHSFETALQPMWNNRRCKPFLFPIQKDKEKIIAEAEKLLLQELLKKF